MEMNQEILLLLAGLVGLILGMSVSPKGLLKQTIKVLEIQPELNDAVYSVKTLNEDIESKNRRIENLQLSISELDEVHAKLLERIQFIQNNSELAQVDEMREYSDKLSKLQDTIKKLHSKNEKKFNMAALINIVQGLYLSLYNVELSVREVSDLINSGFGTNGSFGAISMTPTQSNSRPMM